MQQADITSPNPFQLTCPNCQNTTSISINPIQGKDGFWFASIDCHRCGEHAFFQMDLPGFDDAPSFYFYSWTEKDLASLQQEWDEWVALKQRHLPLKYPHRSLQNKKLNVLLILGMLAGSLFFLLDQYHLLGVIFEDIEARQRTLNQYVTRLTKLPCFSSVMRVKLETVPILYTTESVYRNHDIQYGETGMYWGEFQIKIHRSNFWFFGWPKKSRLIETIIHEARHRASPGLGHNARFYQLVQKDTQCALRHW